MNDDDGALDGVDLPPELQFTEENVRRVLEASDADIAAGRLVPIEDVLKMLKHYEALARSNRLAKTAAE